MDTEIKLVLSKKGTYVKRASSANGSMRRIADMPTGPPAGAIAAAGTAGNGALVGMRFQSLSGLKARPVSGLLSSGAAAGPGSGPRVPPAPSPTPTPGSTSSRLISFLLDETRSNYRRPGTGTTALPAQTAIVPLHHSSVGSSSSGSGGSGSSSGGSHHQQHLASTRNSILVLRDRDRGAGDAMGMSAVGAAVAAMGSQGLSTAGAGVQERYERKYGRSSAADEVQAVVQEAEAAEGALLPAVKAPSPMPVEAAPVPVLRRRVRWAEPLSVYHSDSYTCPHPMGIAFLSRSGPGTGGTGGAASSSSNGRGVLKASSSPASGTNGSVVLNGTVGDLATLTNTVTNKSIPLLVPVPVIPVAVKPLPRISSSGSMSATAAGAGPTNGTASSAKGFPSQGNNVSRADSNSSPVPLFPTGTLGSAAGGTLKRPKSASALETQQAMVPPPTIITSYSPMLGYTKHVQGPRTFLSVVNNLMTSDP